MDDNIAFKHFDEVERKVFEILKLIPLVGFIYRPFRALFYRLIRKDTEEFIYSLTFDVSNLFQRRFSYELLTACTSFKATYNEAIWIGRRSLKLSFGFSTRVKYDIWHYAIMINGTVYHLQGDKTIINVEQSNEVKLKKQFQWKLFNEKLKLEIFEDNIKKKCKEFEEKFTQSYSLIPNEMKNKHNCQTFIKYLVKELTNDEKTEEKLNLYLGLTETKFPFNLLHLIYISIITLFYVYVYNLEFYEELGFLSNILYFYLAFNCLYEIFLFFYLIFEIIKSLVLVLSSKFLIVSKFTK